MIGRGNDSVIDSWEERWREIKLQMTVEQPRGATGFEVASSAGTCRKIARESVFLFHFFPERRKSFKEYQISSDGPEVFTPAIIYSFFFSAAQQGGQVAKKPA